jgi:two-component system sensor histidine kinase KdpD
VSEVLPRSRGRLKIYLSYAAGAGKTYRMLEEGQQLKRQGVDVVIGYFEPHARKDTIGKTEGLETVPRRKIEYRGSSFEEMDTDAILRRAPAVCLVDEFPHTNVPGSERNKRWEDALALLDAGIEVWTTMNLQHLESLNDQIQHISGVRVRETVPDWVIKQATEIIMVDVTPEALINRLKRGAVYEPEKADRALANFFKEQTLVALRELALRQAALEVEVHHPPSAIAAASPQGTSEVERRDRILIHVTSDPETARLIRRGRRVADYLRAECFAVYVCPVSDIAGLPPRERELVERHLNFARNLRIDTRVLTSEDTAVRLVEFARSQRVTQIFLMRPRRKTSFLKKGLISQVLLLAQDTQVIIVARQTGSTPDQGRQSAN